MSSSFPSKRWAGFEHFVACVRSVCRVWTPATGSLDRKAGGRVTSRPPKLTLLAAYANIQPTCEPIASPYFTAPPRRLKRFHILPVPGRIQGKRIGRLVAFEPNGFTDSLGEL